MNPVAKVWAVLLIVLSGFFLPFLSKSSYAGTPPPNSIEKADEAARLYLFAENLYQNGQYYRALTEYQRHLSYYPDGEMTENVMFKIGLCYYKGKKYKESARAFEDMHQKYPDTPLGKEGLFMAGECYRRRGLDMTAMNNFRRLAENPIENDITVKAVYAMGLIYCEWGRWDKAGEIFERLKQNPSYQGLSRNLQKDISRHRSGSKKSPALAGILAIVPGLGHLYVERPGDALTAFLVNGLFTWGAVESFRQEQNVVGGILAFFELGWYLGNISSAVGGAHKYNRHREKTFMDYLEKIELKASSGTSFGAPPGGSPSSLTLSLSIPF